MIDQFHRSSEFAPSGLEFFEASAKENINVKAVFEKLVEVSYLLAVLSLVQVSFGFPNLLRRSK